MNFLSLAVSFGDVVAMGESAVLLIPMDEGVVNVSVIPTVSDRDRSLVVDNVAVIPTVSVGSLPWFILSVILTVSDSDLENEEAVVT